MELMYIKTTAELFLKHKKWTDYFKPQHLNRILKKANREYEKFLKAMDKNLHKG
jgi:hypothetical protein